MVSGLLDQLQIFWQLYLIELLRFLADLVLLESYGISSQIFGLILSLLRKRWLWAVADGKPSREYLVYAGVTLMNYQFELESDLRGVSDWARRHLLISMLEKLNMFRLTSLITLLLSMWKWLSLFLRKKSPFQMLGHLF